MSASRIPIERVVTFFTPIFAGLASWFTSWLATETGVKLNAQAISVIFAATFLGSVLIVYKWLQGRQIPGVAQLKLSSDQKAELRSEVRDYLAQRFATALQPDTEKAKLVSESGQPAAAGPAQP